jgi:hypothetical protein
MSANIKAKIGEMERIAGEIREELGPAGMGFRWHIDIDCHEADLVTLNMNHLFRRFREELYGDLIKAGILPPAPGPSAGPEPGGR